MHSFSDALQSPAEIAVDRILEIVDKSVNTPMGKHEELEDALLQLPRNTVLAINRFASQCEELGATVEVSDRTPEKKPVKVIPTDARLLKQVIKYLGLDEQEVPFDGEWLTYSDVRTNFDIRLKDRTVISGRVPRNLIGDSYAALKKFVHVTLHATQKGGDEAPIRYVLKDIHIVADSVPADFYEQDEDTETE